MRAFSVMFLGVMLAMGCAKQNSPSGVPSSTRDPNAPTEAEVKVAAEIRALVPAAASMPKELFKAVGEELGVPDPYNPKFTRRGSLTYGVLCLDPSWSLEDPTA